MKRFAVAFIYEERPKYDRATFDGETYRFYQGDNLVEEYSKEMMGVALDVPHILELTLVEAETEKEAIQKILDEFPKHILEIKVMEIKGE